ncbi:carboxypeptidase-like regulatory domain-containing protein [Hymenobacter guriensis]|uniref:Carboxypeptidase-like regulatory domain-containing protein n=1 Tax=Hymenobacter guriensis TaxID=2793065 RepID=A0ABS0L4J1_9BACT|nr:carboxypeptidase-like regulatory domain-containing protein [Hymenobacter guriensis]MBG8554458.1 carboxypeptidase-like regulatory domain-containing protein [Hymenobacter guriensis]
MPTITIPKPCAQPWAAMTPTAAGQFCGSCQHEVVDFSRMTEAEVVAWLAQSRTASVCGSFRAHQFKTMPAAAPRWRRWLVAAVALLGFKPLLTGCQTVAPHAQTELGTEQIDASAQVPDNQIIIRGRVVEDSTNQGVAGARVLIGDTEYGAMTDEQGNFSFIMLREWAPVQDGRVSLRVRGYEFTYLPQNPIVNIQGTVTPFTVRLGRIPEGDRIKGKLVRSELPRKPPLH